MWDLKTIIRINEERKTFEKNSSPQGIKEKIKGNEGVFDTEDRVFKQASYLRSVYEGERNGCSPQGGPGETLP